MSHTPQIISAVLALARAKGESLGDVAMDLGIDPTTLMHYRSGRRRITMKTLAAILKCYGHERSIRDAALLYGRAEYHAPDRVEVATNLTPDIAATLRGLVEHLPAEAVSTGRGIYVYSGDAASLSDAWHFVSRLLEQAPLSVCRIRANEVLSAGVRRAALASAVLLIERADFARPPVIAALLERASLVRPIVVTSMQPPAAVADAYLRRVYLSMLKLVEIPSTTPHAASRSAERRTASAA